MKVRTLMRRAGYALNRRPVTETEYYRGEGVESFHVHSDLLAPEFVDAYEAAVLAVGDDFGIRQRMRLLAWAGRQALLANPRGCFVEFGTGRGFSMHFLLSYLRLFDQQPMLYMFDTFESELSQEARARGAVSAGNMYYSDSFLRVKERFSRFTGVEFIVGALPGSLDSVSLPPICLAHVDLNDGYAEVQAIEGLWPNLLGGALVVLDDFANRGRMSQRAEVQSFFDRQGLPVLSTPQGQGLVIKP